MKRTHQTLQAFRAILFAGIVLGLALDQTVAAQEQRTDGARETTSARPYLRWDRPEYRSFALQPYSNYPNHSVPYEDAPRAVYGPMGNYLTTGYDLYSWSETRQPGQEYGSAIFKPGPKGTIWNKVYDATVVGRDGYGDWAYSMIVADGIISRFSPLTLSQSNMNGFRLDVTTPHLQFTGLASRIERPHTYISRSVFVLDDVLHVADDSTLLLGGRAQAIFGGARLGLNWVNTHVYQSTQSGNGLKGVLRPDQTFADWIVVRFSDDSPEDGRGGAVVQDVRLVVNGEARPDLAPRVLRHAANYTPQVGSVSAATGSFRPVDYTSFRGHRLFYRGRDDVPFYSDYFFRLDHEAGIDVSGDANLPGMLPSMQVESATGALRADGTDQLAFLFDLSQEPRVETVQIEALLSSDYRVDVAFLTDANPRGKSYHARYSSTFYRAVLRSKGNVQDQSNMKRVRFHVGENTGLFTYSADLNLALPGLELTGEYARSSRYSRYPARADGNSIFDESKRFSERGSAYYLNATHWFQRGRIGGELFAINPDYTTSMRTFLDKSSDLNYSNISGMLNNTLYWDLVQDNDDADRFADRRVGNVSGFAPDEKAFDLDGVFVGQDADNDGLPEINRNLNNVADFDEPFLMYDVEPNIYVYGLDRNNNDEPDHREDDGEVDYPYDFDQKGLHFFGALDLTRRWSLALGRYDVDQIAGPGRNRSTYSLLTYQFEGVHRLRKLFFENHLRRVQDDIADEYIVTGENASRVENFSSDGLRIEISSDVTRAGTHKPPIYTGSFVTDTRFYQDSYVNESYVDASFQPLPGMNVVQKLRFRINWQQGGELYNQTFQRERRLDFWSWVSRADHTWRWGNLSLTPQYKFMVLRLTDQDREVRLFSEKRSIPILRLEYQLFPRTMLRAGLQGIGPLPYRLTDDNSKRNGFDQRTAFATLTNRTKYFGYDLITIVGLLKNSREYDTGFRDRRNFDEVSFFMRGLVGFTEFGPQL